MISVEFLPLLLRWSAVIIIKKNKKLRKHHQVYGAITFQLLFFPPRCVHIPHRSCKFQLSAPVCFAEGGFQLNKCVAAVCDVAAAYSSSFLLSLAADGQLEVTTSAGVHSPPDMQPNTAWHKEKEVFFFLFFALLELEHLLLFASVLWCAYVLFLGRMLFSAVIRMPASSTASFRAFYYFEGKNLRAEKLLSVRGGEQVRSVTLLMPVPYPTRVIFICTYKPDSLDRPWMFFVFRYFYSILQSFVGVELHVYVKCMMKYLFVNIQDMLYITHHIL